MAAVWQKPPWTKYSKGFNTAAKYSESRNCIFREESVDFVDLNFFIFFILLGNGKKIAELVNWEILFLKCKALTDSYFEIVI